MGIWRLLVLTSLRPPLFSSYLGISTTCWMWKIELKYGPNYTVRFGYGLCWPDIGLRIYKMIFLLKIEGV